MGFWKGTVVGKSIDFISYVKIQHLNKCSLLRHEQRKECVSYLAERGLLAYDINNQDRKTQEFKTTEKGLRYLKHIITWMT